MLQQLTPNFYAVPKTQQFPAGLCQPHIVLNETEWIATFLSYCQLCGSASYKLPTAYVWHDEVSSGGNREELKRKERTRFENDVHSPMLQKKSFFLRISKMVHILRTSFIFKG